MKHLTITNVHDKYEIEDLNIPSKMYEIIIPKEMVNDFCKEKIALHFNLFKDNKYEEVLPISSLDDCNLFYDKDSLENVYFPTILCELPLS